MKALLMKLFEDLKVVELAAVLAGPAVGTFFAEGGASVIKVENATTGGDMTRKWFTHGENSEGVSAYFSSVNYGKEEYLMLNYNEEKDLRRVYDLISKADIVISNFSASAAHRFGLDFASLRNLNPHIISAELTGFPNSDRPAFDVVLQAETGFISMTGSDQKAPAKLPVALIDVLAAHQLKEGVLTALWQSAKGDTRAKRIRVSLYEAALASLVNVASNFLMAGHVAKPIGTKHPNIAPYGDILETTDGGKVVLAVGTQKHFANLCGVLERTDLTEDRRFSSNALRVQNRDALMEQLREAAKTLKRDDLMDKLLESKVPAGAVKTVDEVLNSSEARRLILRDIIEGADTSRLRGNVFQISTE